MLKGKTVVLGVTGSIAAYKIANLASMLVKQHADVHVIMTKNATNFINPITFETLTNHKCLVETFDRNFQFHVAHVSLAQKADVMLIAPASANIIAKLAHGIADDMLSTEMHNKNKGFFSFLYMIAVYYITQLFVALFLIIPIYFNNNWSKYLEQNTPPMSFLQIFLLASLILNIIICFVYYKITTINLEKRLNLE